MNRSTTELPITLARDRQSSAANTARARDSISELAQNSPPSQHPLLGLQTALGNRATEQVVTRHHQIWPKSTRIARMHNSSQQVPITALQQVLGNRGVARLFQTNHAPSIPALDRKCTCGNGTKEECAQCNKPQVKAGRSHDEQFPDHTLVRASEGPLPQATVEQAPAKTASLIQPSLETLQELIQRACLPAASCTAPPGSATVFGNQAANAEAAARARRAAMSPTRQRATGHVGPARQLENFFNAQSPGLLSNIHGVFIDQDMDASVEASTQDCNTMVPPITGATKPCVFVHGQLNQEALKFNTDPTAITIGGKSREDWRIATLQTLTHEVQHVLYDTALGTAASPVGVACARADVESELSELNAILSEFPAVFDAVPAGASAGDPARVRLDQWFKASISNPGESIQGTLKAIDCKCSCPDTDAYVKETVAFVTSAWPTARKDALNAELKLPVHGLRWPL